MAKIGAVNPIDKDFPVDLRVLAVLLKALLAFFSLDSKSVISAPNLKFTPLAIPNQFRSFI